MNKLICVMCGSGGGKYKGVINSKTAGGADFLIANRHTLQYEETPAHKIPYIDNFKYLLARGVTHIISISSVGSLHPNIHPGEIVLLDQYIDLSRGAPVSMFDTGFNHASMGLPFDSQIQQLFKNNINIEHIDGVYVNISGPQFSSRAESIYYKDIIKGNVIGMTNAIEAKLARECNISYTSICMVTDYDSWNVSKPPVTIEQVMESSKKTFVRAESAVFSVLDNIYQNINV